MIDKGNIKIELTKDQALVLFALLTRIDPDDETVVLEKGAEQKVIWDIEAQLERVLPEPFMPDYLHILAKAKDNINAQ